MSNGSAGQGFEGFVGHAYWGLDKIVSALEALGPERWSETPVQGLRSPREIMMHMWGFENFWSARLRGEKLDRESPPITPATFDNLASLLEAWRPVQNWCREHTAGLTEQELDRGIELTWMDGTNHAPPSRHVLSQFVQHQGQHRSKLAVLVSAMGESPGDFDLWDFLSEAPA